jgi:hypothetical protein
MFILKYFDRDPNFPNPRGQLSYRLPRAAIVSANSEVRQAVSTGHGKCRGPYNVYTPEERAMMGNYTVENGVMSA